MARTVKFFVMTVAACFFVVSLQSDTTCPRDCSCVANGVECANRGFKQEELVEVFEAISTATIEADVVGNFFFNVTEFLFWRKMDKLRYLNLGNNSIERMHASAFTSLPVLNSLYMDGNKIKTSPTGLFRYLESIEELSLQYAFQTGPNLTKIFDSRKLANLRDLRLTGNNMRFMNYHDSDILCLFPKLRYLVLAQNGLRNLNVTLACAKKSYLRTLDVSINNITAFSDKDIAIVNSMKQLDELNISKNPFHCGCETKAFLKWISLEKSFKLADRENLTCVTSSKPQFTNMRLIDIDVDHLDTICSMDSGSLGATATSESRTKKKTGAIFGIVLAVFIVACIVTIYKFRQPLAKKAHGALLSVRNKKKHHYEFIESEFEEDAIIFEV